MTIEAETPYRRPLSGDPVARPPSGRIPARAPIEGELVRIEAFDVARHAGELHPASHATEEARRIWEYLPWGPWATRGEFDAWLAQMVGSFEYVWYAFRTKRDGRANGMACYLDIAPAQGVIEIGGIWFAPEMQRTRAATETLFLLMSYAMDEFGYRRLQWRCNALNEKSRNAARRLGHRFEGIFHNHMIVKGRNRDTAWYSITEAEWPEVRGLISAWLDDANFDADGIARRSLTTMMGARE